VSRAAQDSVREQLAAVAAREPARRWPRLGRRRAWHAAVLVAIAALAAAQASGLL
jgi:hypothetical protein